MHARRLMGTHAFTMRAVAKECLASRVELTREAAQHGCIRLEPSLRGRRHGCGETRVCAGAGVEAAKPDCAGAAADCTREEPWLPVERGQKQLRKPDAAAHTEREQRPRPTGPVAAATEHARLACAAGVALGTSTALVVGEDLSRGHRGGEDRERGAPYEASDAADLCLVARVQCKARDRAADRAYTRGADAASTGCGGAGASQ